MYIANGFVCGGYPELPIRVVDAKPLENRMLLLTFAGGAKRLFDAAVLCGPAFAALVKPEVFRTCKINNGVVTWLGGEIDCAPEYMYEHSYEYSEVLPQQETADCV